jgi:hypothetical protein
MLEDFKRALARVQTDYGFYIGCQGNPTEALAGYDLSPDERSALTDPKKLADVFKRGIGIPEPRVLKITISGTHDWINRAVTKDDAGRDARVEIEVNAIRRASTAKERSDAIVRLVELIG